MRSDVVLFDQSIPAGTSNLILRKTLTFGGYLRETTIQFYPGQQKSLQVKIYMEKAPDIAVPLSKYAGDRDYFSGDDSKYEIAMNMQFGKHDILCVEVSNVDSLNDYDLYVLYELVYGEVS